LTNRQRQKRNEDQILRQPASTPVADAAMIGATAGGLVMALSQANAEEPQQTAAHEPAQPNVAVESSSSTPVAPQAEPAPEQQSAAQVTQTETSQTQAPLAEFAPETQDANPGPDVHFPPPATDAVVEQVAQQIAGTVARVAESVASGTDTDTIANEIVGAARQIVASLQPANPAAPDGHLVDQILGSVDPVAIVGDTLAATSGIADAVLDDVAGVLGGATDLAQTVLDDVAGLTDNVAALPASLLGFEGSDLAGGLLSDIFYDDGQAELADVPVMPEVAVLSDAPLSLAALGQGLTDADLPGLHLNALSLL